MERFSAFCEAVVADPQLQQKLNEAADVNDVVAIAKASGFDVTIDEINAVLAEASDSELSAVSGGISTTTKVGLVGGSAITVAGIVGSIALYIK